MSQKPVSLIISIIHELITTMTATAAVLLLAYFCQSSFSEQRLYTWYKPEKYRHTALPTMAVTKYQQFLNTVNKHAVTNKTYKIDVANICIALLVIAQLGCHV